jgi:glyoxylate/hydroxypyruvate reductase A
MSDPSTHPAEVGGHAGDRPPVLALLSAQIDLAYLVPALRAACPEADIRLQPALGALDEIDAALCWAPPPGLLATLPRLQLVQSLGAGIDHLTADPTLPDVPLCRCAASSMPTWPAAWPPMSLGRWCSNSGTWVPTCARRKPPAGASSR